LQGNESSEESTDILEATMVLIKGDGPFDEEELVREGGVFVSRSDGREVGAGEGPPDDLVEDPLEDRHVPGTVDDLPYDLGVETALPADEMLGSFDRRGGGWGGVGETGYDPDGDPPELGGPDERELWAKSRALRQEDDLESARAFGLSDEELAAVERAMGDDAAEALPDAPDGTSAVGSVGGPEG
jgi:hypothetical protein